jgi:hypothetical protein
MGEALREAMSQPHFLIVSPSLKRDRSDNQYPGRFDVRSGDRLLVARTRTPFCDGARALIARGVEPNDRLVMRHTGSGTDALRGTVGGAASLSGPIWQPP